MKNIIKIKSKPYQGENCMGFINYECKVKGYAEDISKMLCLALAKLIIREGFDKRLIKKDIDNMIKMIMEEENEE